MGAYEWVSVYKMGYEAVWKVLSDLVTELRRRDEAIPPEVMEDLRSAKTMIQILKADPARTETLTRIETYLEKVESRLFYIAREKIGPENAEQWMQKLAKARRKIHEEVTPPPRFVPALPRDKHWVRIQVSEDTPREDAERLAEGTGLSYRMQENGYLLVYGDEKGIKSFVKKMAEKFRGARK